MRIDEYITYDGLGLAELVRKKEVKPRELVELAIKQIELYNPKINAVIHTFFEKALKTADEKLPERPFTGVPFLIKDLIVELAGEPIYRGNKFRYDHVFNHSQLVSDHDSEIIQRFKKSGLIILGKTNTPEYGITPVTEPRIFGPCNNPWNLGRTSGGSSGGSAAAVAARIVPMAHGADGGGSIRIPASCCGLFGLKPSRGRIPYGPKYSEYWHGLNSDFVLSLSVRDSAVILDYIHGIDLGAPYDSPPADRSFLENIELAPGNLTIAATSTPLLPSKVDPDCIKAFQDTVEFLRQLGHTVVEKTPEIDGHAFAKAFLIMTCAAVSADMAAEETLFGTKAKYDDFEPTTWALGLLGKQFSALELETAIRLLKQEHRSMARFFEEEGVDILLTPTLALPPLETGALQPKGFDAFLLNVMGRLKAGRVLKTNLDSLAEDVFAFIPWTPVFNATGQPAMSVPLQWNSAGLPIGMHFVGKYGDEATLFSLAAQLEKEKPWRDRLPPICQA